MWRRPCSSCPSALLSAQLCQHSCGWGGDQSQPVTSFPGSQTQQENLLCHHTGDPGRVLKAIPAKLCGSQLSAGADAGEAAASPRQLSQLAPKPQWEVLSAARARSWGDIRAGPSLPSEKQGTLAGHGQVQAGVQIRSELVGWGISEVMLGHPATARGRIRPGATTQVHREEGRATLGISP